MTMTEVGHDRLSPKSPRRMPCYRIGYSVTPKAPESVPRPKRQSKSAIKGKAVALGLMKSRRLIVIVGQKRLRYCPSVVGIDQPTLCGSVPVLFLRNQLISLPYSSEANSENPWLVADRCRLDWRPTIGAECLLALAATLPRLCVDPRFAQNEFEVGFSGRHDDSERGA